jgi:hypothetical protein
VVRICINPDHRSEADLKRGLCPDCGEAFVDCVPASEVERLGTRLGDAEKEIGYWQAQAERAEAEVERLAHELALIYDEGLVPVLTAVKKRAEAEAERLQAKLDDCGWGDVALYRAEVERLRGANDAAWAYNLRIRAQIERLGEALDYIATMLEGDTDRMQIAQYIRDDLLYPDEEQRGEKRTPAEIIDEAEFDEVDGLRRLDDYGERRPVCPHCGESHSAHIPPYEESARIEVPPRPTDAEIPDLPVADLDDFERWRRERGYPDGKRHA